jgi:SpoVK/Ycf46/Vps4 family AAA+-type ATPase
VHVADKIELKYQSNSTAESCELKSFKVHHECHTRIVNSDRVTSLLQLIPNGNIRKSIAQIINDHIKLANSESWVTFVTNVLMFNKTPSQIERCTFNSSYAELNSSAYLNLFFPNIPVTHLITELILLLHIQFDDMDYDDVKISDYLRSFYRKLFNDSVVYIPVFDIETMVIDVHNIDDIITQQEKDLLFMGLSHITGVRLCGSKTKTTQSIPLNTMKDEMSLALNGNKKAVKPIDNMNHALESSQQRVSIQLIPKDKIQRKVLLDGFNNYVNTVIDKYRIQKSTKRTVFMLKMKRYNEERFVPNPEYAVYKERKDMMASLTGEQTDEKTEKKHSRNSYMVRQMMYEFMHEVPPTEFIIEYDEKIIIEKKEIKKFSKPIDTLYLRKTDKDRLVNVLNTFKNNSEVYVDFGVPKKLGVLGHGTYGTGKTTTIYAMADYLETDIYYLDLNGITKNCELKQLFDYVREQNLDGGIIVLEDIDAMTHIVHDRKEADTSTRMIDMENDDLSLSYLLNMLDGALCSDNTIFVITTNHKEKLDGALYRKGRIDIDIEFKKCDRYQFQCVYEKIIKRSIPDHILENIEEDVHTPAEVVAHLMQSMYGQLSDSEILKQYMTKRLTADDRINAVNNAIYPLQTNIPRITSG